jgi:hypothetical protein
VRKSDLLAELTGVMSDGSFFNSGDGTGQMAQPWMFMMMMMMMTSSSQVFHLAALQCEHA